MAQYCTIAQVKNALPTTSWQSNYDALLSELIDRATWEIDMHVKRWSQYFAADTDTIRYFDGHGGRELLIDEMAALPTTVAVCQDGVFDNAAGSGGTYVAYTTRDYYMWPYNALANKEPFRKIILDVQNGSQASWYGYTKGVKITGKFGYCTSANRPSPITQATLVQVVRWFKRGQQAFQDAGAIIELGQLMYVQKLDPDIAVVIDNFMEVTV